MMQSSAKLIIGNWKMHGSLAENAVLLAALQSEATKFSSSVRMAVCVPFPYVSQVQANLQNGPIAWGVQDISAHQHGAYTGEVAASMAAEFGVTFVIVGHSERRAYHHESDAEVTEKTLRALEAGLTPIVCVGETRAERDAGRAEEVVGQQLKNVLDRLNQTQAARLVVAYEPVWAIGAAKSASAQEAQAMHSFLRSQLAAKGENVAQIPLLYGGSVKASNAAELFGQTDIDGGLIGGASLDPQAFLAIYQAATLTE